MFVPIPSGDVDSKLLLFVKISFLGNNTFALLVCHIYSEYVILSSRTFRERTENVAVRTQCQILFHFLFNSFFKVSFHKFDFTKYKPI